MGFARRATAYKRASLIFQDKSWIEGLLEQKKIQLIFAGKNHPEDLGGKTEVEFILKLSEKYPQHIIFLENYNMDLGKLLTQGVDVWLNNPKRPLEASGTSGMKAGANGVLNLSTLDGWWEEACEHGKNGWQFGDGLEIENEEASLENDLTALKKCLENEVIPTYYDQQKNWQQMMLNSIESVSKNFSADRMLNDYFEVLYR